LSSQEYRLLVRNFFLPSIKAIERALELDPEYFEAVKRKKRLEVM
jgi:hypothetical protein